MRNVFQANFLSGLHITFLWSPPSSSQFPHSSQLSSGSVISFLACFLFHSFDVIQVLANDCSCDSLHTYYKLMPAATEDRPLWFDCLPLKLNFHQYYKLCRHASSVFIQPINQQNILAMILFISVFSFRSHCYFNIVKQLPVPSSGTCQAAIRRWSPGFKNSPYMNVSLGEDCLILRNGMRGWCVS